MLTVMLAFTLLTTPATAQSTRPDATDKTNEVIQKAIAAMGGIERIHALHSLVYRGFHFEAPTNRNTRAANPPAPFSFA